MAGSLDVLGERSHDHERRIIDLEQAKLPVRVAEIIMTQRSQGEDIATIKSDVRALLKSDTGRTASSLTVKAAIGWGLGAAAILVSIAFGLATLLQGA